MPEGVEIKRSTDFLHHELTGKGVISISDLGGRYKDDPPEGLLEFTFMQACQAQPRPITITSVRCKGKFQYWSMGDWSLWCTYGMSGQWNTRRDTKHCAATVTYGNDLFDGHRSLHFNDPRHFGTLKFVNDPGGGLTRAKLDTLGPDMLADPPSLEKFIELMTKQPNRTLCEVLLDQRRVSGIGNYIKAESLYLSELSPHRTCASLSVDDWERLRQQVINVMRASYNTGGATISTYRNPDGSKGNAQRRFVVYGHKTDPLGNPVVAEKTKDGRTTWWVPKVQR